MDKVQPIRALAQITEQWPSPGQTLHVHAVACALIILLSGDQLFLFALNEKNVRRPEHPGQPCVYDPNFIKPPYPNYPSN